MGEVYYAEATAMRRMGIPTWGTFHYKEHSHGGALLDVGVHMLDLAIYLMDNPKPVRVSAQMAAKFGKRPEIAKQLRNAWDPAKFDVEDFAVALVHFANGATLLLRASWATHIDAETFSVRLCRHRSGRDDDAAHGLPQPRRHPGRREAAGAPGGLDGVVHARDRALAPGRAGQGSSRWSSAEETLNVQRIIDAAYRSAGRGARGRA